MAGQLRTIIGPWLDANTPTSSAMAETRAPEKQETDRIYMIHRIGCRTKMHCPDLVNPVNPVHSALHVIGVHRRSSATLLGWPLARMWRRKSSSGMPDMWK
jgi:hypothetical protein